MLSKFELQKFDYKQSLQDTWIWIKRKMMDRLLPSEANQLILAVEAALSPTTDPTTRAQSYALCERFKEEANPLTCTAVGFQLASSYPSARHFGLQLVEHCIKFRWLEIQPQEKMTIKVKQGLVVLLVKQ